MRSTALFSRIPLTLVALLCAAGPAAAQGGFQPGDLVIYNPALTGSSTLAGGVARIDPVTGQVTTLALLQGGSQSLHGSVTYDPFRAALIFRGSLVAGQASRLWACDAAGTLTDLGVTSGALSSLTAGSGGRIYARGPNANMTIAYIDSANQLHTLLDATGTQPFLPPQWDFRGMQYHAGLNALFVATHSGSAWSCGGNQVNVHRLRLSADGSRVTAVDGCASVLVDPLLGSSPVGLSWRPDGALMVVADNNSNAQLARMNLVDPHTLAVTPLASNGVYVGAGATNAGTWSQALGKAVILDTLNDVLRAFAPNEVGAGQVIVPSQMISSGGGSGETATLIEIPAGVCSNLIGTYCTAKTTSQGCVPAIATSGCPSASAAAGFTITAGPVPPSQLGIFFYGQGGPAAVPFQGGFLCMSGSLVRTPPMSAGGVGACGGQYALDFNAYAAAGSDPLLQPGSVVHGQFWFRDPPDALSGTGLSGGVTFTLAP